MNEIVKNITERNPESFINELLFEKVPYIFGSNWELYRTWRYHLGETINVDPCEIIVIGSAAIGFSLNPIKRLKPFDSSSDVDVAIISDYYFSEAWHHLRSMDATVERLSPRQRNALTEHQTRYVYWGCVATDKILPLLPFAQTWLKARSDFAAIEPTTERMINFRVYKDFRALRGYQLLGLKKLRSLLIDPQGGYDAEFP